MYFLFPRFFLQFNDFVLCEIRNASLSASKDGQVTNTEFQDKRSRNDDEHINKVTLQPQLENEDTRFQNMCHNPELCEEEYHYPKRRRIITSCLTEEAPTENPVSLEIIQELLEEEDHPATQLLQLENQDISIQGILELWEAEDEPYSWQNLLSWSSGIDYNFCV
jgi:hypothetical protein